MVYHNAKLLLISLSMTLFLNSAAFAAGKSFKSSDETSGVLVGQFKKNGKTPLANGRLFIYSKAMGPPSADRYVRVPDQIANLDKDGRFSLELPAGTYYLSAIKVPDDGSMGPPAEGTLIYFKMDSKGKIQGFNVSSKRKTNAGVVSTSFPYKRSQDGNGGGATMVEGIVTDSGGAPVEGAVILAYVDPDVLDKAAYVSVKTAKDGKFVLRVNDGGNYYLRVRGEYGGGTPKEGEIVSINDPKELIGVTLTKGERLSGVSIQVKRHPQRGPLKKGN